MRRFEHQRRANVASSRSLAAYFVKINSRVLATPTTLFDDVISFSLSLSLSLSLLIFFLLLFFPSSLAVRRGEFENRWGAYGAEKLEVPQRGGNTSCVSRANTRQCVAGGREREREKSRRKRRKRRRRLKQTWSHTFFISAESQSWRLFAVRGSRLTLLDKGGDPYLWSKENIFSRARGTHKSRSDS